MMQPLRDRVLIKPIANSDMSKGGIYKGIAVTSFVPDKDLKVQTTVGEVLAVGLGIRDKKGKRTPPKVPIGSIVFFSDTCLKQAEDSYCINERDIIGLLSKAVDVEQQYED